MIIKAYSHIAKPLQRFKIIDRVFSSDKDVQQTLAIFYSDILKFHKEAYRFVRRSCKFFLVKYTLTGSKMTDSLELGGYYSSLPGAASSDALKASSRT